MTLLVIVGAGIAAMAGRVAYLQTYGRQATIDKADRQHHRTDILPARRGSIFDRNGALMACSIQNQGLFVDPKFMYECYQKDGKTVAEMDEKVRELAQVLDRSPAELARFIGDRSEARYLKLAESLDEPTISAVQDLDIPGVGFFPVNQRIYPMGGLAAHVLGGVGKDGKGLEGIELAFEQTLAGRDGSQYVTKDARRRAIAVAEEDYHPPEHGKHLILTIDANIQMIAEQELLERCMKTRAKRGEVVVVDPATGDILALANYPTFSPQNISESDMEARRNNCLVAPFEPGSTLKPFIVGPALADGLLTWGRVWPISAISWATPYGRRITDTHGYGPLTTWDVLVKSSNIGMCMIAGQYQNANLHKALRGFHFGETTGIELHGESRGMLRPLASWSRSSTESIAQGYEIMVTPLQLARAMCGYATGGYVPSLRVVRGTLDGEGKVVAPAARPGPTLAVAPDAAAKIRRILADVPLRGTASTIKAKDSEQKWAVDNWWVWNIFGKTGTAHISEGPAGYSSQRFNSLFIGGAPYENPRLVVAFVVHEPDRRIAHFGGAVSAPGAGRLLTRSLAYMQAPPSPQLAPPPADVAARLVNFQPNVYKKPTPPAPPAAFSAAPTQPRSGRSPRP